MICANLDVSPGKCNNGQITCSTLHSASSSFWSFSNSRLKIFVLSVISDHSSNCTNGYSIAQIIRLPSRLESELCVDRTTPAKANNAIAAPPFIRVTNFRTSRAKSTSPRSCSAARHGCISWRSDSTITSPLPAHHSSRGLQSPDHAAACAAPTQNRTVCRLQPVQILHNRVPPPRARRHLSAAWSRAGRAPGLPAPGSPDMCGCDRAGQAGPLRPDIVYIASRTEAL